MEEMIAYCGLNCSICPTFIATQNDDDQAREETAAFYAKEYGFNLTAKDINCDGCHADSGRLIAYCQTCDIRKCGQEKQLDTCAACNDQPCDKLIKFHKFSPEAKACFDKLVQSPE